MAGCGQPLEDIADLLEISPAALRQHFSDELLSGAIEANPSITIMLFDRALSGDLRAMIHWLKSRAGWKQNNVVHPIYEEKPSLPNGLVRALRKSEKCRNASTADGVIAATPVRTGAARGGTRPVSPTAVVRRAGVVTWHGP